MISAAQKTAVDQRTYPCPPILPRTARSRRRRDAHPDRANYSNLEYDLSGGERGGRAAYLEHNLALLCGAQAATVVNNCAAALVLILRHFTAGDRQEVIISRGELIQIGGGFRIPEILEAAGARLREVGTTNKTSLNDYAKAIGKHTAMILKVHRSNFFMGGFVESPATEDPPRWPQAPPSIGRRSGSGAMVPTENCRDRARTDAGRSLEAGRGPRDLQRRQNCCGPQAGLIAGKAGSWRRSNASRSSAALRCDKLILCRAPNDRGHLLEIWRPVPPWRDCPGHAES
jgi:L-seryl-tRNA(Ser) seleniumtransferase